jgi:hypothetical protein
MSDERAAEQGGSGLDRRTFMQGMALAGVAVPAVAAMHPATVDRPAVSRGPDGPDGPKEEVSGFAAARHNSSQDKAQLFAVTSDNHVFTTWQIEQSTPATTSIAWSPWQLHPNSHHQEVKVAASKRSLAVAPRSNSDLQVWVSYDRATGSPAIRTCFQAPPVPPNNPVFQESPGDKWVDWQDFPNNGLPGHPAGDGAHLFVIGAALSWSERIQLFATAGVTANQSVPLWTVFQTTPSDPDSMWAFPWSAWSDPGVDGLRLTGLIAANLPIINKSSFKGDPVGRMQLWLTDGKHVYSTWKEAEHINAAWSPITGPWRNYPAGPSLSLANIESFAVAPLTPKNLLKLWANDIHGTLWTITQDTPGTPPSPGTWDAAWQWFGNPVQQGVSIPVTNITAVPLNDGRLWVIATQMNDTSIIWSRYQKPNNGGWEGWTKMAQIPVP